MSTSVLCQIVAFVFAAGGLNRPPEPASTFHGALSAVATEWRRWSGPTSTCGWRCWP